MTIPVCILACQRKCPKDFRKSLKLFGSVTLCWATCGAGETKIDNYGFEFDPVYTGEVLGNPSGGIKQGVAYDQSLNLPVTIYLDRLADWWDGGTVHANALWIAGRSLSADDVGDISGVSNIAGYDTLRLQELWFQQTFWKMRASIKAGLLAADAEFFTSDTSSLFINGTFGAFTLVGANLPNPPVYPMAAPGVRILAQPIPQFYFQSGAYNGNSNPQDVNKHGLNFQYNSMNGALIFSEVGWLVNQRRATAGWWALTNWARSFTPLILPTGTLGQAKVQTTEFTAWLTRSFTSMAARTFRFLHERVMRRKTSTRSIGM